jgi:hypothetical protein
MICELIFKILSKKIIKMVYVEKKFKKIKFSSNIRLLEKSRNSRRNSSKIRKF